MNVFIGFGIFAVCVFLLTAMLLPLFAEPGKDGWDDVD